MRARAICASKSRRLPNPSIIQLRDAESYVAFACSHPVPPRNFAGVKVGDTVLLPDYGGQKVDLGDIGAKEGKETFLYSDQEILGIVESS